MTEDGLADFRKSIKGLNDEQLVDMFATMVLVLAAAGADTGRDGRVLALRTDLLARMNPEKLIR